MGGLSERGEPLPESPEGESARRTYLYLRVSLVGAVLLVAVALVWQIASDGGSIQSSISRYYYTPAMSVFVGTLVAMGIALIALAGRPGPEEAALNLAGMLAPVVAFVPTPIEGTCPDGANKCVPDAFVPAVINNMSAFFVVGALAIVFSAVSAWKHIRTEPWVRWGLIVAAAIWTFGAIWFGFSRDWPLNQSFLSFAHYGAAVPMFVLIIVVVMINGWRSQSALSVASMSISFRPIYKTVGGLMAATVVIGLAWWAFTRAAEDAPPVIFIVEAVLLGFFLVFWTLQTLEFRRSGLPEEARRN